MLVRVRSSLQRVIAVCLANLASLLLCLLPGAPALAGPIALAEILDRDPLGYECIPSQYFEDGDDGAAPIAFSLSGKTRLPRTCLPDPCARALSPRELSQITGTEPILASFSNEWDDYYSRYADHCVREIVISRPRATDFWKPIIDRSRETQRLGIPTSSRLVPFIPGGFSKPTLPIKISFVGGPETGLGPSIAPSPVPVPASGVLLLAAVGMGGLASYRRRRAKINS